MFFFPFSLIFSFLLLLTWCHIVITFQNKFSYIKLTAHKMTTFCGVTPYVSSRFYDRSNWILTDQTEFWSTILADYVFCLILSSAIHYIIALLAGQYGEILPSNWPIKLSYDRQSYNKYIYCVWQRLGWSGVPAVCGEFFNLAVIHRSVVVLSPSPLSPFYFVFEN